jgi:hypothetical protein
MAVARLDLVPAALDLDAADPSRAAILPYFAL